MNDEQNEKKRMRKSVATVKKSHIWGKVTQKAMTFKIDLSNAENMAKVKNKGRLINDLLAQYFSREEIE